ncbi:MAG: DUF481 domain-containing protein [Sedimentisphaerales bacterium]|nr:DUF481 domain-containing protein [Sedimentisphaerales bacterium]
MRAGIILFLAVAAAIAQARADVVEFTNGDRLTGRLIRLEAGKLLFQADAVGELAIDMANVKTFSSAEPAQIHLQDGTVITSRMQAAEAGRVNLEATELIAAQTVPLAALGAINPVVKPPVTWSGSITVGMTSTHGNTFQESANIRGSVTRRSLNDRLKAQSTYLASRSRRENPDEKVTTEESFAVGGKYDYFLTKKLYTFVNADFKKDHIADLDYRMIGGAGLGYQWIEEENLKFSTDAGVSEICEKYSRRALNPPALRPPRWVEQIDKNDEVSGQLGYSLDWVISEKFTFAHTLRYYPSFASLSDYYLNTDAELRAAITKNMFGSLMAILDYDSTPGEDVGTTDTKYILGVGWKF